MLKKLFVLKLLYDYGYIIVGTGKLIIDINMLLFNYMYDNGLPRIDCCKCNVCTDFRLRNKIEPNEH